MNAWMSLSTADATKTGFLANPVVSPTWQGRREADDDSSVATSREVRHRPLIPYSDLDQQVGQRRLKCGEVRKQIVRGNQVGDDVDRIQDVPLRDRKSN